MAADAETAESYRSSGLAGAMTTDIGALGAGHLAAGLVLGLLTASPSAPRLVAAHALQLTLVAAPILLIGLADVGQLRPGAKLVLPLLAGCAAVTLAFEVVYDHLHGGIPSPLVALPVRFLAILAALVALRLFARHVEHDGARPAPTAPRP
jgi:hypothetical protein